MRRVPARPVSHEIDEQTPLGEVYMHSLIRSQRRLAVIVCALLAIVLVGTVLVGVVLPGLSRVSVLGVPLPWLLLGVLVYPVLIALGIYAVRQAERNESAFSDLVHQR